MKTSELRPCDNCGASIAPIFYRVKVSLRQMMIDRTAVNQVLGTAQIFGGNLRLGSIMSPNRDAAVEMPAYQIDKDLVLCQECATDPDFSISPVGLMMEHEEVDGRE